MSVIFLKILNTGKNKLYHKLLKKSQFMCNCKYVPKCTVADTKFTSFDVVTSQRRAEARRSIVVQVNSKASYNDLCNYCSKYATINGIYHYKNPADQHFMLIEFSSEDNLKEVLRSCGSFQKYQDVMPLESPFLQFRLGNSKGEKASKEKEREFSAPITPLIVEDENSSEEKVFEDMMKCTTISEQIQLLYDRTSLGELGIRLRYIVARQLECLFDSLYAHIAVRPFGSSVNGFGKNGCDLDLVVTNSITDEMHSSTRRLVYKDKKGKDEPNPSQVHMRIMADLLDSRMAGAERVLRILHARVPIIKFRHAFAAVDCDVCYNNMSGVYMSELLWALGALDARLRPLGGAVRRWARGAGLTSAHPGGWITNFPLSLMVIFYLQQALPGGRILPSLKELVERAGKEDIRVAERNIDCTFLRDVNKLSAEHYSQNNSDLETLLYGFFEFYSKFDFKNKAISINEGAPVRKTSSLPIYIVNPLEKELNVTRNVSIEQYERIRQEMGNAARVLEGGERHGADCWGLLTLIETQSVRNFKNLIRIGRSHRLISVKDLWVDTPEAPKKGLKNNLKRLITESNADDEKSEREKKDIPSRVKENRDNSIKYKNNQIEKQIKNIIREKLF